MKYSSGTIFHPIGCLTAALHIEQLANSPAEMPRKHIFMYTDIDHSENLRKKWYCLKERSGPPDKKCNLHKTDKVSVDIVTCYNQQDQLIDYPSN